MYDYVQQLIEEDCENVRLEGKDLRETENQKPDNRGKISRSRAPDQGNDGESESNIINDID